MIHPTAALARRTERSVLIAALVVALAGSAMRAGEVAEAFQPADGYGDKLGTVRFPASCGDPALRHVQRGVALLHHMTYEGARAAFDAAQAAEPGCVVAYWGAAMTAIHPLWSDTPDEAMMAEGRALVARAGAAGEATPRERAYVATVAAYYEGDGAEAERLARFAAAWERVHRDHPNDVEAASFYALARIAIASPVDKTYAGQLAAGAIVEAVLAAVPDHPGAHHYIIHAYDVPELAPRALHVARHYGQVAPDVPHALHMPTHIFTRLGLWEESIDWNRRSAAAAWREGSAGGHVSMHYLHALDYLAYAYLQQGEDDKALQVAEEVLSLAGPFPGHNLAAAAYALAAIPARAALEHDGWGEAARLEPRQPASFPWDDRFLQFEAITHFARALGAARSGDAATARAALAALRAAASGVAGDSARSYWADQVSILARSAGAWLAYVEGREGEAVAEMQAAAAQEAATAKHAITPGEILPAGELLGDLLLATGHPEEALAAYEAALVRSPNRFRSLHGAAIAATQSKQKKKARAFYEQLVEIASHSARDEVRAAREALESARRR